MSESEKLPSLQKPKTRLVSLDAMRGANMFFIMGGAGLLMGILHFLFPGNRVADWIADQMHHVEWHGFKHHDSIFPTFLFIAGCTYPFSFASQLARGYSTFQMVRKVIFRGLILVILGVIYNSFSSIPIDSNVPEDFFSQFRYASVLGHIGLGWMFAALIYIAFRAERGARARWIIVGVILVGYWLLLRFVPNPNAPAGTDPFSMEGCLVTYIDQKFLPGALCEGGFDPEGILSTIPAIGTALLGIFAGEWLRKNGTDQDGWKKVRKLVIFGVIFLVIGLLWNKIFPINKKIWTSSFVCFLAGCDMLGLAFFYGIIDVVGWKKWAFPFVVIGMNSITVYLAPTFIRFSRIDAFFYKTVVSIFPDWTHLREYLMGHPEINEICYAFSGIFVLWVFLYILYRNKLFLKV